MPAEGKINTVAIAQETGAGRTVRILARQNPDTGALTTTLRKTGAVAVTVTKVDVVGGNHARRYQLTTTAGIVTDTCAGNTTHWLARDKDPDAAVAAGQARASVEAVGVGEPNPRPKPADGFGPVDAVYAPGDRVSTVDSNGRTSVGVVVDAVDPVFKDGRPVQPWDTAYTVRTPVGGEIYKDTTQMRRELPVEVGQTWTATNSRGEPSTLTIGSITDMFYNDDPHGLIVNGVGFKPRGIALSSYDWAQITSGPHEPTGTVRRCDIGGEELTGPYWLLHGLGRGWEDNRGAACAFHTGQPEPEQMPDAGPAPRDGYARYVEAADERAEPVSGADEFCGMCSPGHDAGDGTCERHGKRIRREEAYVSPWSSVGE